MGNRNKNRKKYNFPKNGVPNPTGVEAEVKIGMNRSGNHAAIAQGGKQFNQKPHETVKDNAVPAAVGPTSSPTNGTLHGSNAERNLKGLSRKEKQRAKKRAMKRDANALDDTNGVESDVSAKHDHSADSVSSSKRSRKLDSSDSSDVQNNNLTNKAVGNNPSKSKPDKVTPNAKDNLKDVHSVASKRKPSSDRRHGNGMATTEPRKVAVVQVKTMENDNATDESDSDEEEYINKFFSDVSDEEADDDDAPLVQEKKNPKPKPKIKAKKKAAQMKAKPGGWIVEKSDCSLEYAASSSDEEKTVKPSSSRMVKGGSAPVVTANPKTVVAFKRKVNPEIVEYNDSDGSGSLESDSMWLDTEDEVDDEEEVEEEEYYEDDGFPFMPDVTYDELLTKGYDSDSYDEDVYGSDSYDEDYETDGSSGSPNGNYKGFMNGQPYETDSDDEDYEPPDGDDTVYIPMGTADIHDLNDDTIQFDESRDSLQIVELPADYGVQKEENRSDQSEKQACEEMKDEEEKKEEDEGEEEEEEEREEEEEEEMVEDASDSQEEEETEFDFEDDSEHEREDNALGDSDVKTNNSGETSAENQPPEPSVYLFCDSVDLRMSLVVLRAPLYLYGHLCVQVLFGKVDILGYQLDMAEEQTVYAPIGYDAINLTPLPNPDTYSGDAFERIMKKLNPHFAEADMDAVKREFNPADSALVLLRADSFDENDTVPKVCRLLPDFGLFPTLRSVNQTASPFVATEALLEVSLFKPTLPVARSENVPQFQPNPAWDTLTLTPASRMMIVGGRGAGKSTLCQYLINRHIKQFGRVLLIDLDIGQPLLFAPETLTASVVEKPILGVGCFANVQPRRSHLFGSLQVVSSPLTYVQNVRTLVKYCREDPELKNIPWLINTMGYAVGFGEELTMAIVRLVQPTDLVQLTFPANAKQLYVLQKPDNFANTFTAETVNGYRFNILQDEVKLETAPVNHLFHPIDVVYRAARDTNVFFFPPKRRTVTVMALLSKILNDSEETFTDVPAHVASLDDLGFICTGEECNTQNMIKRALNGTLVYLCEKLENDQHNCLGMGIVHSVDEKKNTVNLLHALSPEQLAKTNALAIGSQSLPSQIYLNCSRKIEGTIPYLQNMAAVAAEG